MRRGTLTITLTDPLATALASFPKILCSAGLVDSVAGSGAFAERLLTMIPVDGKLGPPQVVMLWGLMPLNPQAKRASLR